MIERNIEETADPSTAKQQEQFDIGRAHREFSQKNRVERKLEERKQELSSEELSLDLLLSLAENKTYEPDRLLSILVGLDSSHPKSWPLRQLLAEQGGSPDLLRASIPDHSTEQAQAFEQFLAQRQDK